MKLDNKKKTTIKNYKDTAFEVYNFLTNLPEHLARFIFKRIVSEAYDTAMCYPVDEIIPQLAFSVSNYYNMAASDKAKTHLANYLGLDVYTMERVIQDTEMLTRTLLSSHWERLPDPENLVKSFECFSFKGMPCDIRNIDIWGRLDDIVIESETVDYATDFYNKNCFYQIGYITALFNDRLDNIDTMAFHWYCKGHIMDVVLGCIWANPNIQVSDILYKHLLNACANHNIWLITKARYDIVKKTKPGWTDNFFISDSGGKKTLVKGLGLLPYRNDKDFREKVKPFIDFSYKLKEKGYIACSSDMFVDIFSKSNDVTPIEWEKDKKSLAAFTKIIFQNTLLFDMYNQSQFYNAVLKCIHIKEEGIEKEGQFNTLKTYFYDTRPQDEELFTELIIDCGIKK